MRVTQLLKLARIITPALYTDGATATGVLDTKGHNFARIVVVLGNEETTHAAPHTVKLQEAEVNAATSFADITDSSATHDLTAGSGKYVNYEVDLKKRKRYIRVHTTLGTTTGGDVIVGAHALLSNSEAQPGAASEEVVSTHDSVSTALA